MTFDFAAWKREKRADPEYRRRELDRDNATTRTRRKADPTKFRAWDAVAYAKHKPQWWERSLKRRYGIEKSDWGTMVVAQAGHCKVCHEPCDLVVDHNHTTGKVRGLLCTHCNRMLGAARDNPDYLREGAKYLEESK